jgi:O-antigen ligase
MPRPGAYAPKLGVAVVLAGSLAFGLLIAAALSGRGPSTQGDLVFVAGLAALGVLALALARYDAAVMTGFLLLGAVKVEPAPTDAVFALAIAIAMLTGRFRLRYVPQVATALISIFLVLNLLSATNVVDPSRAAHFFMITVYLSVFSLWLASYVRSERRAKLVLCGYLIAAVLSAVLSLLALFSSYPASSFFTTPDGLRATGLFKDANVFGPFLIPPALILIEEIITPRALALRRPVKAALLLPLVLGVLFSYSRAAWLNFAVSLVVMLAVMALRRRGARNAIVLAMMAIAFGATASAAIAITGSNSFLKERARLQAYDTQRFQAQDTGIHLAEHHPLGIGPGQFEVEVPLSSHSIYIRTLAEYGIGGFVCVFAILLSTLLMGARNVVLGRDTYGIGSAALLGAWCGLIANSAFVDTLHWRHLFVVAALIWAGAARPRPAPQRDA